MLKNNSEVSYNFVPGHYSDQSYCRIHSENDLLFNPYARMYHDTTGSIDTAAK